MKNKKISNIKFITVLVMLSITGIFIGKSGILAPQKTTNLSFEKNVHDFGEIIQNKEVTAYFKYKNTGDKPLLISDIKTKCGCTTSNWDYEELAKEAIDSIAVHFDAENLGYFSKEILVIYNFDKNSGPEKVFITGTVIE